MNVIKSYLTKHPNYTQAKKLNVKGLMLHSVGCAQPSASVFAKKWNNASMKKGVHAMIDANTGDVLQFLPWVYKAWHCGGTGNSTHIGVEMCESNYIKYGKGATFTVTNKTKAVAQAETAYKSAVELFAVLCRDYSLDPLKAIVSHSEGHRKGIASNHGDPEHYWKGLGLKYTMDGFRQDVKTKMMPVTTTPAPKNTYKIKVTADTLNVRASASALSKKVTSIKKGGVYTITEIKGNWGELKSGAGWINLKYTTVA